MSDDHGNAYLIDVIAALQFVVDHGADYGIRVVNLSLGSSLALPYEIDPLNAAVEAAWAHGVVVVVAAGNRGSEPDAVSYSPANDPYVITVGAVDDQGTKTTGDDSLTPWSSRGVTQDGFAKPDIVAPGAHIVAPLAPDSDFASLCPGCVVDERYFRIGGTSMAAPIVAGIAADMLSVRPELTPDEVKGALTSNRRRTKDGAWEVAADSAIHASKRELESNQGLAPSWFLDPETGAIDYTRASWRRASWRAAVDGLRASWRAESWTCELLRFGGGPDARVVGPGLLEELLRRVAVRLRRAGRRRRWRRRPGLRASSLSQRPASSANPAGRSDASLRPAARRG